MWHTPTKHCSCSLFSYLFIYNELILSESPSLIHHVENATYMQKQCSLFLALLLSLFMDKTIQTKVECNYRINAILVK